MTTVLVVGGAGYVGSHACKALAAAGYTPVVYDDLSLGHEWAVKWGPLEVGDIHDAERLDSVFQKYAPVAVMHFAAYAYVGESMTEPEKYYQLNVSGTLALLSAMRRAKCHNLVFSSSCTVYGDASESISESHAINPINPYGVTKAFSERMIQDFGAAYGLNAIAFRYFNAAGADPDGEIGEDHDPEPHLIPVIISAALGNRDSISVFGTDYPTPDGSCVRDYVHVADLAQAHVLGLQRLLSGGSGGAFNLANGKGYSVFEVIEAVKRVSGKDFRVEKAARRPGDPASLVAESYLARKELGWTPKFETLDSIVETAWNWHKGRK